MSMPGSHHGLIWVISSSDVWALWVRFWHVKRGYGSCILNSLFAYIRYEFGLLPLFPLQHFCPELSVSNYNKSTVLLILSPSWEKVFLEGFGADSFKSIVVCVEPAVTGLVGTWWPPTAMFLYLGCNRQDITTEPQLCVWAPSVSQFQAASSSEPVFIVHSIKVRHM